MSEEQLQFWSKKDDVIEFPKVMYHSATDQSDQSVHVSNSMDTHTQGGRTKEHEETTQNQKDDHKAVSQSSPQKSITKRQFVRIFTYEDDKKILKALRKTGYTIGSKRFWEVIGSSLELSIPVDQKQLYGKIRRLKQEYLNTGYKDNPTRQERRIYKLSHRIWKGEVPEAKAKATPLDKLKQKQRQEVHEQEKEEDGYDLKLEKFVRGLHNDVKFPVAESLVIVPASKRSKLEKKWNDLNGHMFRLYMAKIDLIRETMQDVLSSPSFPSPDHE